MKLTEISSFLNPFGETLATFFVLSIISLSVFTLIWLFISAKAEKWEDNWYGGDLNDDTNNLASEHGSVYELSEAVATKAEKVADIMPSMVLVVGLLGTFLGLGIALNKASTVLAMADTAGMDSAMTQLMGLMDGLGAKFKTSTWGILCFILLNVFFNILGFKEKRLAWAIKKVREESELKKKELSKLETEKHNTLINTLKDNEESRAGYSKEIIKNIANLTQSNIESKKIFYTDLVTFLSAQQSLIQNSIETQTSEFTKVFSVLSNIQKNIEENNQIVTNNAKENIAELKKIASYNRATQKSMQEFVSQTVESMASIGDSADKMAVAASEVGSSAESLNSVVKNLRDELESVMDMIKQDLSLTINNMGESFEKNMESMSINMSTATLGISKAVDKLSISVDATMKEVTSAINESMTIQQKSSNEFTVTSGTLNEQIFEMTDLVKRLSGDITSGLKAVSESGRRMKALDSRYDKYSDLIQNITESNQELSSFNNKLINYLPEVTKSISELKEDVNSVVLKSVSFQTDLVRELTNTGDKVDNKVLEMSQLFNKLSIEITKTLKAVCENENKLKSLNERYDGYSALVEDITKTNQKLLAVLDKQDTL